MLTNSSRESFLRTSLLLLAWTLVAWFPAIHEYRYLADDFNMAQGIMDRLGLFGFVRTYYQESGLWRIVGHTATMWIASVGRGTVLPPLIFLTTHALNASALKALLDQAGILPRKSFFWAILYVAVPFGIQAILWASAFTYVLSFSEMLLLVWLIYMAPEWLSVRKVMHYSVLFTAAAAIVLTNEALMILAAVSGMPLIWNHVQTKTFSQKTSFSLALIPIVGVASALVAVKVTLPAGIRVAHIRPQAILSACFYQVTDVMYFAIITCREAWTYLATVTSWPMVILAVVVLVSLAWGLVKQFRRAPRRSEIRPNSMLIWWLSIGVVCVGAIHVLGSGYSLDSRKRYPFVGILIALAALCWERYVAPRVAGRTAGTLLAISLAFSLTSTWLWAATWEVQSQREAVLETFRSSARTSPARLTIHTGKDGNIGVPYAGTVVPNLEPVGDYESLTWKAECYHEVHLDIQYGGEGWRILKESQRSERKFNCEESR